VDDVDDEDDDVGGIKNLGRSDKFKRCREKDARGNEATFLLFFLFEIREDLVNQLDSGREAERYTGEIKVKETEREREKSYTV